MKPNKLSQTTRRGFGHKFSPVARSLSLSLAFALANLKLKFREFSSRMQLPLGQSFGFASRSRVQFSEKADSSL